MRDTRRAKENEELTEKIARGTSARWYLRLVMAGMLAGSSSPAMAQKAASLPALAGARISPTLYFPSAAEEQTSRSALHARVSLVVKEVADSDEASLGKMLDTANETLIALQRHASYLRVQTLESTQNREAEAAEGSVDSDESVFRAAMSSRLRRVPPAQVASLGRYAYLARQAQQDAAHAFSPDVEQYRGAVTQSNEGDIANAYGRVIGGIGRDPGVSSPNLATRRTAIKKREEAYDNAAPVIATLLGELVDLENRDAAAQGYANAADRKYDALGLSPQVIQETLTQSRAEASVHLHYEQVLAEHAERKLGVSSVLSSEEGLGDASVSPISLEHGRQLLLDALQPLG